MRIHHQQHPEHASVAADGVMTDGTMATQPSIADIPLNAEVIMVQRGLDLVEATGAACAPRP
jgi:dihydroorotase-like cyclic amidohydrolase